MIYLLARGGETASLAALVDGVDNPVDARVALDRLVRRVDQNDFVVLVYTVLVDPIRAQDAQVTTPTTNTLLCKSAVAALGLEVVNTLADGLAVGGTWDNS